MEAFIYIRINNSRFILIREKIPTHIQTHVHIVTYTHKYT